MSTAWLLLPDLVLIVAGFLICRHTALDRPVWEAAERLVDYLLFPVLLFGAIVDNPRPVTEMAALAACGLAVVGAGIVLAYALRLVPGVDARAHASGVQVAYRFNSYVALALAERPGGAPTVAAIAVLISVCVPLCNVAAVWPLARRGGQGYLRELVRNPLIVATVAGLAANLVGVKLPDVVGATLHRVGAAALPPGLMAVGAGLRLGALNDAPRLAAALLAIRHLALPATRSCSYAPSACRRCSSSPSSRSPPCPPRRAPTCSRRGWAATRATSPGSSPCRRSPGWSACRWR